MKVVLSYNLLTGIIMENKTLANNDINTKLRDIEERIESFTISQEDICFLEDNANHNNPLALCDLGMVFFLGLDGKEPGFGRAIPLFDKASELGDGAINFLIYITYKSSFQFMPDMIDKAESVLLKACSVGFEPAMKEYRGFAKLKEEIESKFISKA